MARDHLIKMSEIAAMMREIEDGREPIVQNLLPLVYDELRRLAAR